MKKEVTFAILKEKNSPSNVLVMAELIAISETKFLIGYMGVCINTMSITRLARLTI